jgi:hypothetical protein
MQARVLYRVEFVVQPEQGNAEAIDIDAHGFPVR